MKRNYDFQNSPWYIVYILVCIAIVNIIFCIWSDAANTNTRTIDGEVYSIDFPTDERDWCVTTIITEDGHLWEIEDYVATRFTTLHVTFDTMGTSDITDDEIVQIINIWNA